MKPYVIIAHIYSFVSGICFGSSFVLMIRNIFSRFELDPGTIWEIPVEWYIQNINPTPQPNPDCPENCNGGGMNQCI